MPPGPCKLDWNHDGRVDLLDLYDESNNSGYYWEWFVLMNEPEMYPVMFPNGSAAAVDWDGDGSITGNDLLGTNPLGFYHHLHLYTHPRSHASYLSYFPGAGCARPSGSVGNILERDLVGTKSLLVIPLSLSRSSLPAIASQAQAQAHGAQVSQMLSQQSHGRLDLQVTATPVVDLPQPASYYYSPVSGVEVGGIELVRLEADIIAIAARHGYDVTAYDYALVLAPKFWANNEGFAPAWKMCFTSRLNVPLAAHELGHTFGWSHAGRWDCSGGSPICAGGTLYEDGDHFDIMGQNGTVIGRFCPWRQKRARWLDDAHVLRVTRSGSYRIKGLEVDPQTLAAREYVALELRIDELDSYWVYLRGDEPLADDGAIITRTTNAIRGQSILYDMTTGTPGVWQDARLAVGRTFTDSSVGVSVTVLAVAPSTLDVRVTVPPGIASIPDPPVIDVISPTRHETVSGTWTFVATAYDPKQGIENGAGIRRVTLRLNGTAMEAWADLYQPPYELVVNTRSGIPDGQYRLWVEAEDMNGRLSQTISPLLIDNTGPSRR